MSIQELAEEVRNCRDAIRYLARVIDRINGSQNTPDNHYDEAERILDHDYFFCATCGTKLEDLDEENVVEVLK